MVIVNRDWYYMAMEEAGNEKLLGQRLQQMRKSAGMTQQDLCHKADLSYSTLAKIERGAIKSPSIFTIQNIASALGVGMDVLLGNTAIPNTAPSRKMTAQSGVRFVYFDINGCLVRLFHSAFTRLAADTNSRPDQAERLFWHYNDAVCRGEMPMDEFNAAIAQQLQVSSVNWQEYYLTSIEPIKEMRELVDWVSERYYVGLVSNIMPGFIPEMQRRDLLPSVRFDSIIDSSIIGAIKPEKAIFDAAALAARVDPSQILLVDDDRSNLMAAERLGWQVLWFDDYQPAESVERVRASLVPSE